MVECAPLRSFRKSILIGQIKRGGDETPSGRHLQVRVNVGALGDHHEGQSEFRLGVQ